MKLDNILDIVKKASFADYKTSKSDKTKSQEKTNSVSFKKENNLFSGVEDTSVDKKSILESFEELSKSDVDTQRDYMAIMSNVLSRNDFNQLMKDGYSLSDSEVEHIVTVVDKIKVKLAQAGVDTAYTRSVSVEAMESVTGSKSQAMHIAQELEKNNLPATQENINDIEETMELSSGLEELSESAVKYMLENNMEPTVTNFYRAEYSSQGAVGQKEQAYYTEGLPGYYARKSQDFNWQAIEGQMEKIIHQAGLEVTDETMGGAKWMVEKGIPLTEQTITNYVKLQEIELPIQNEKLLQDIINTMKEGNRPQQVLLTGSENHLQQAVDIQEKLSHVSDDALKNVVFAGKKVTIENLVKEQKTIDDNANSIFIYKNSEAMDEESYELVSARRQLEEVRLMMSVEASYRMLKQGIEVETSELSKLVEDLKAEEQQYEKALFESKGMTYTKEAGDLYREAERKIGELAKMPMVALGRFTGEGMNPTVNEIYMHGVFVRASFETAQSSYETMMTTPRSDMGDSIQKAFQNVDSILRDLSLEATQANQRAVKILAFNRMAISKDSIAQVKQADMCMNRLMQNMSGDVTLELIKRGKNPLDTDIYTLNAEVEEIKTQLGSSTEEKYSEFLWKLEKNQQITPEQRNAYIGIYRLFYQIEKAEGAVVGALLNQGAEITLRNLITGVKSAGTTKAGGIKVTVDDNFGGIASGKSDVTPMQAQINEGFSENNSQQHYNEEQKRQQYYTNLVKEVMENMEPEKLVHIKNVDNYNISLENFGEQMKNIAVNEEIQEQFYQEKMNQLKDARMVEGQVIKMLLDYEQPVTVNNLVAADGLMNERGRFIRQLLNEAAKAPKKNKEKEIMKAAERVTDRLISEEAAQAAYEELTGAEFELVESSLEEENLNYVDVRSLKMLHQEIKLTSALSREENYEIPVKINEEITSINLKIIKGSNQNGTVAITMQCDKYGKIAASFRLKTDRITGLMVSDTDVGYEFLRSIDKNIKIGMAGDSYRVTKLNYAKSENVDLNQFSEAEKSDKESRVNTVALYQCAKTFIGLIQSQG